jgi:hypothetical protein
VPCATAGADQALEAGHAPDVVTAAIHDTELQPITGADERAGSDKVLGPRGLTEQTTTFDRRVVLRGWCDQLPTGAPITTIERLAAATLEDPRVIALQARDPYPRYSTVELIALERRLVGAAVAAIDSNKGVVNEDHLRAALDARPELSAQQVAAVAAITTSGNGIDVVVAAAGTGKTFCLDAAHDAWRRAGYRVVGAALAATAASELQAQTGIPSDTIALRTLQLAAGILQFDPQTVVVIDEAAMASTRGLASLIDAAHDRGAKVVMVGDPHQLDAIDAGGLLNGLAQRLQPVTLTENRRQQQVWERQALSSLRAGRVVAALDAYEQHDRVVVAPTAIDVRNRMAADWYAATVAGDTVVMLAERRYDVDDLNERARRHLIRGGVLTGPELCVAADVFQTGDRILCIRNNRRIGVRNGTLATVIDVDPDERALVVRTCDGNTIRLPSRYLDDGHVRHGYARTIHKTQGLSVDRCLVLASDTLDHHGGYTALSRGRIDNRIYLVAQAAIDIEAHHHSRETADPRRQLATALQTDYADRLAIDHRVDAVALGAELVRLYNERALRYPIRLGAPPDRTADIAALDRERHTLIRALDTARTTLDDVVAHRPRLRRRQEHAATLLAAERARDHAAGGLDRVHRELDEARRDHTAHQQYQSAHGGELAKLAGTEGRIDDRLEQLVDALAIHRPRYLASLGSPPSGGWERQQWRRAVRDVEAYRAQHNVTDPRQPFGARPTDPGMRTAWHNAAASFALDGHQLGIARDSVSRGQQQDQGLEIEL